MKFFPAAAVAALLWCFAWVAEASDAGAVVFVLDCSSNMGQGSAQAGSDSDSAKHATPPMQEAIPKLKEMVADAAKGQWQVGVVLFGHRLGWSDDGEFPNLMEQDQYLQANMGYNALSNLVPGEDVERVQSLKEMSEQDQENLAHRLETVQAWGESPLYLALLHAAGELKLKPWNMEKRIVVLTSGENNQRYANHLTKLADVERTLNGQRIELHFVRLPDSNKSQTADLKSLARTSSGRIWNYQTGAENVTFTAIASSVPEQKAEPAAPATPHAVLTGVQKTQVKPQKIEGVVRYYGKSVTKATVRLEGSSNAEVDADKDGKFTIDSVEPGTYKLVVRAIAKNKVHNKSQDIVIKESPKGVTLIEVDLK